MSAFWDDVDDEQMTHSDEPTTTSEAPTNEAAVWKDGIFCWRCYWYDIGDGDKLDSREREHSRACRGPIIRRHRHSEERVSRLIADVEAGERHLQSLKDDSGDIICDLEDQVKRLEAERGGFKDALSAIASPYVTQSTIAYREIARKALLMPHD